MTAGPPEQLPSGLWVPTGALPSAPPSPTGGAAADRGSFVGVPHQVEQLGDAMTALTAETTQIRRLVATRLPHDAFGRTPGSQEAGTAYAGRAGATTQEMRVAADEFTDLGQALRGSAHTFRRDNAAVDAEFTALASALPRD